MSLSVDLCSAWVRIGEAPAASLRAAIRDMRAGEWELSGATSGLELATTATIDDVDTIRVVDGDRVVFGGYVAPLDAGGFGGLTTTVDTAGHRFTLAGPDMWAALASRFVYPTPSSSPPWPDGHDVRTGLASTVATEYLDANLGASALTDRQFPGAVLLDGLAGTSGTWSGRLQRLDEWVVRVCTDGGITCRPTVGFDGALRVYCGPASNRSTRIVLTDDGDLTQITTAAAPAVATYVVAGGQGELAARAFVATGGGTGSARRELFVDQTGIPSSGELAQAATSTLAASRATNAIVAVVADAAAQRLTFGRDYDIGDVLAAHIGTSRYQLRVTSVTIELGVGRHVIRPAFAEINADPMSRLIRAVGDLETVNRTNIT